MEIKINNINSIEDEFNIDKVNEVFKPIYEIIKDKDKSLQRKLQMIHNAIVILRKEFDGLSYHTNVKERNKILNRLKYHRKKANNKETDIEFFEAF